MDMFVSCCSPLKLCILPVVRLQCLKQAFEDHKVFSLSVAPVTAVATRVGILGWLLPQGCAFLPRESQSHELSVPGTVLFLCCYVSGCQVQTVPSSTRMRSAWQLRLYFCETVVHKAPAWPLITNNVILILVNSLLLARKNTSGSSTS